MKPRFPVERNGGCERMRLVKNDSRGSSVNNWKKGSSIYRKRGADLRNNLKEKSAEFGDLFHNRDEEEGKLFSLLAHLYQSI